MELNNCFLINRKGSFTTSFCCCQFVLFCQFLCKNGTKAKKTQCKKTIGSCEGCTEFFRLAFFPFFTNFNKRRHEMQLKETKKCVVKKPSICARHNVFRSDCDFLLTFSVKVCQKLALLAPKLFVYSKQKVSLPRNFLHFRAKFCVKVNKDRMSRKKMRSKRNLVYIAGEKLRFLENFAKSWVLFGKWHLIDIYSMQTAKSRFFHLFPPPIAITVELKSLQNLELNIIASVPFLFRFNQFLAI